MKRLILFFSLVLFACCMLVATVSAEAYTYDFGEVEYIDFFENYADTHDGVDYITVAMKNPQPTSKESRTTVSCTCEKGRHTYPTYYFMAINPSLATLFERNYTAMNENNPCGVTYNNNMFLAVEVPEGCTDFWGSGSDKGTFYNHTNLVYVKIPLSLKELSVCAFKLCSSLEWVDFGNNNKITTLGNSTFNGCVSLKGVCLPDSITSMQNATFIGCTGIGPIHLPDSLTYFGTAYNWNTFQGGESGNGAKCTNLFFTNERFDNPDEVVKPEVYYMPSNFQRIGDQGFRGCTNINNVIVFPSTFTSVADDRVFLGLGGTAEQPKTVVFLGNMTQFKGYAHSSSSYTNFVFANSNDVAGDFTVSFTSSGASNICLYSCASGKVSVLNGEWTTTGFTHFANQRASTQVIKPGNCTEKSVIQGVCYCGAEMGEMEGWTNPSAHEFDTTKNATLIKITYESFGANGTKHIKCARCTEVGKSSANPIITTKGYSVNKTGTGLDGGYFINTDALNEYETLMGAVKIGIIIANSENAGTLVKLEDGEYVLATSKGLMVEMSSREYRSFSLSLQGFTAETAAKLNLVITAYIIADYDDNAETIDTVGYVQHDMLLTDDKLVQFDAGVYLDTLTLERIKQEALLKEQQ